MQKIRVHDKGVIQYADALVLQTEKFDELIENKINNIANKDAHHLF